RATAACTLRAHARHAAARAPRFGTRHRAAARAHLDGTLRLAARFLESLARAPGAREARCRHADSRPRAQAGELVPAHRACGTDHWPDLRRHRADEVGAALSRASAAGDPDPRA